ncbi:flavin reductase family protein [Rhodococcus sp. F64268]|uniref:flavin reductase family protein n=1 Tax=Rhodococcus sp. F64268 TaxID=2926402 RepID=UPI001FF5F255|nr:flavin reductase family protein [Rhodococcus sp. F64268]MCK0090341.1 flavin reductase family protein [Rhodococcus sp. F64268]
MSTTSTPSRFTAAFRAHPAGVALVTADAGGGPVALTATSVASVSADPPMLMFSVSDASSSSPTIAVADTVVVHLLGAEQLHLAKLGATSGIDRFADVSLWERMPTGEVYFRDVHTRIRARAVERVKAGAARVIVVEALEVDVQEVRMSGVGDRMGGHSSAPLVYHDRGWHSLGDHSRLE